MGSDRLFIHERPRMKAPRLVIGFSGWMNGGEVSTGTVGYLTEKLDADLLAEIDSEDFYILNFPGTMEITSLFRPRVTVENGIVTDFRTPENTFYCSPENNVILFLGSEPNIRWWEFTECIFELAETFDVSMIYFIGSVGGAVPHTRQPRLQVSISDEQLRSGLQQLGFNFTNYTGPGGISSYLIQEARERKIPMVTVVAEIPPYVQGRNDRCIESMIKVMCGLLLVYVDHEDLRRRGDELEKKLNAALEHHPELLERIRELEDKYDREIFDSTMDELKQWLTDKGIRLD